MFEEASVTVTLINDGSIGVAIVEPASPVLDSDRTPTSLEEHLNIGQVYSALVLGIRDYFSKWVLKSHTWFFRRYRQCCYPALARDAHGNESKGSSNALRRIQQNIRWTTLFS